MQDSFCVYALVRVCVLICLHIQHGIMYQVFMAESVKRILVNDVPLRYWIIILFSYTLLTHISIFAQWWAEKMIFAVVVYVVVVVVCPNSRYHVDMCLSVSLCMRTYLAFSLGVSDTQDALNGCVTFLERRVFTAEASVSVHVCICEHMLHIVTVLL